uniref:DUF433 domain-containing protein n=1 Tax=Candidatus Kentrum sp. UNK TaxID=2126344 RepID=A0A451AXV4_9GAMM|nr:MAG: Protein of unknown function (DUF433) [Candidatus Kentron sp. UNK]VFK70880.1 MAG: Protein of unknown function (DUF433) [Candidatus Kentron sp. UNK]
MKGAAYGDDGQGVRTMTPLNRNEYFEFLDADDIRITGARVGIETVLEDYLNAMSPEEIALRYPTLALEQVYATITFYLRNRRERDWAVGSTWNDGDTMPSRRDNNSGILHPPSSVFKP